MLGIVRGCESIIVSCPCVAQQFCGKTEFAKRKLSFQRPPAWLDVEGRALLALPVCKPERESLQCGLKVLSLQRGGRQVGFCA